MPPQTPTYTPGSLDPQAVMLAKAIRQTESGGNATAKGKSGEYGAYQYTNNTWLKDAASAGVQTPLNQSTMEDQNKVAYTKIKSLKDKGLNPGQIASSWNAGEGEPDAYKGTFSNGKPSIGRNNYGVQYDVPAYAKSVATAYQKLKGGQQVGADPQNPSSTANQTPVQDPNAPKKDNFLVSMAKGIAEPVATMLARPIQAGAELLGASEEQVNKTTKDIAGDWVAPVPHNLGDVSKDVGRGLETVALGMPVGSIAKAATLGGVAGVGSGLEQGGSATDVLKQGAIGAGFGAAGGVAAKGLEMLPKWLGGQAFEKLSPDEVQQALQTKSMGTASGLLKQSQKAVANYGNQIDNILSKTAENGGGDFAVRATTSQFPEFAGKEASMLAKIKRLIPAGYDAGLVTQKVPRSAILSYIDKIQNGTATLIEKNAVRSAIDSATSGGYAKLARSINPSAGHDLAMTFAGALRNEVKQSAPETIPIFDEFAKEMAFKKAVQKVSEKGGGGLLKWSDIVPYMIGSAGGGPAGGLALAAANRAANSPTTVFNLAKGVQGIQKTLNPVLGRAGLVSTLK